MTAISRNTLKIGIITSKGGHLLQIAKLKNLFQKYDRFWVTFAGQDVEDCLNEEQTYLAYFPESRNILNFIKNLFLSFKILYLEQPNVLISSGAGIAVPFFLVGKIFFRTKLIYIESFDFVKYPSLTGKILYQWTDLFLIQHKVQKKWYPNATFAGSIL